MKEPTHKESKVLTRSIRTLDILEQWGFCWQDPRYAHWDRQLALWAADQRESSTLQQIIDGNGTAKEKCWVLLSSRVFAEHTLRLIACDIAERCQQSIPGEWGHLPYSRHCARPIEIARQVASGDRPKEQLAIASTMCSKLITMARRSQRNAHAAMATEDVELAIAGTISALGGRPSSIDRSFRVERAIADLERRARQIRQDPGAWARELSAVASRVGISVARMAGKRHNVTDGGSATDHPEKDTLSLLVDGQERIARSLERRAAKLRSMIERRSRAAGADIRRQVARAAAEVISSHVSSDGPPRVTIEDDTLWAISVTSAATGSHSDQSAARSAAWIADQRDGMSDWILSRIGQYIDAADRKPTRGREPNHE